MSAVLQLHQPGLLAPTTTDPLSLLTDSQRDEAMRIEALIMPAIKKVRGGLSVRAASDWLWKVHKCELQCSQSTARRWLYAYFQEGGLIALAPKYTGRVRKDGGWEARALYYRRLPSCASYATIAGWLVDDDGFDPADATPSRVQRYLESLPKDQTDFHGDRVGHHFRRLNLTPKKIRDRFVVPVGMLYQGDGHSLHYYVRHPNTGRHCTPELTPWMDIGSRYITGFFLGYSESAVQTLYSLSDALRTHNHVPALLHVDPGSGFKNKAMCDAVAGFAPRIGAEMMTALAGNAPGKGDIEGFFRWFEERHGKKQSSYKGKEVAQEFLRNLEKRIERGDMYVPYWDEALEGIRAYITRYNEKNQENLGGVSPAKLWERLERSELHIPANVLVRPREIRVARSYDVAIFNRVYRAAELKAYEGLQVQVEYDLHNDAVVWLYDVKGRFIAQAVKVKDTPFLSQSRIEDLAIKQRDAAIGRLERKAEIIRANHNRPITAASMVDQLEGNAPTELPYQAPARGQPSRPAEIIDMDAVRAEIRESERAAENPAQRFGRWLSLRACIQAGEQLGQDDQEWFQIYGTSAECLGHLDVYEAFGTVPGLANAKGSAPTEPSASTSEITWES
ncbi:transposase [Solimonas sp. SE-A11]|uniref:transposase n=1 Tax=Solimonas sp. SE-A11 TaxID=3054954 RepID=UPI00259D1E23|nr:transposase [Solimonas sp. SE-A11]MDM4768643.1 transposase [Solimonas sp. SE-A11]